MLMILVATAASCSSDGAELQNPATPIEQPTTWAEVDQSLDDVSSEVSMIAAEVADDGTFVILHERNPEASAAIGSAVSIYVLGMMTDQIAGGDLSWDAELPSAVTVSTAATAVIADGDETALDLLIEAVGRDQVEYLMPSMGLGEESQARTLPLMTTRERATLAAANDDLRAEYVDADVSGRRDILKSLEVDGAPSRNSAIVDVSTVGWFASASELARAQLWLDSQRGLPGQEPLEAVLAANSGVPLESTTWTRFGFVDGKAPGVLSLSWLLQRSDGRRFVIAIIANDSQRLIDDESAMSIGSGVIDLVAQA